MAVVREWVCSKCGQRGKVYQISESPDPGRATILRYYCKVCLIKSKIVPRTLV